MKRVIAVIAVLIAAVSTSAQGVIFVTKQPPGARVWHYITTHKELLVSDVLIGASEGADIGSSIHCQNVAPVGCVETNPVLGRHPSAGATAALGISLSAGIITLDHLLWHMAAGDDTRHLILFSSVPIAIFQYQNVKGNVDATERLQSARVRVLAAKR